MPRARFDSTKIDLEDLLKDAGSGVLQLPDFQRGWIWDDERIRSLLASVSMSFPIGAVMLLQTGGQQIRFKPRPLAGTNFPPRAPDTFILDGQQRLTSLNLALMSQTAVETKNTRGKKVRRWYYIDMKKAVDPVADREDAILSVPEDLLVKTFRGTTLDVTSPELEYANDHFPVNKIFDKDTWRWNYNKHWKYAADKGRLLDKFESEVIESFKRYQVPVIELKKETPKEAVCLVFERVNTGGVSLTVFELLTASFAAENFQLREDWDAREKRLKTYQYQVLCNLKSVDFLQAISLLVTQQRRRDAINDGMSIDKAPGISCKRKEILKLKVADWKNWADRVEDGFVRAARFLYGQNIFTARDLPYRTQLVPLAAIFTDLGNDGEKEGARLKIARWYWCGVLGELYGVPLRAASCVIYQKSWPGSVGWGVCECL